MGGRQDKKLTAEESQRGIITNDLMQSEREYKHIVSEDEIVHHEMPAAAQTHGTITKGGFTYIHIHYWNIVICL